MFQPPIQLLELFLLLVDLRRCKVFDVNTLLLYARLILLSLRYRNSYHGLSAAMGYMGIRSGVSWSMFDSANTASRKL